MGHANADLLLSELVASVDVDLGKVVQLSMDGPNVNLKLFKLFTNHVKDLCDKKPLDIGSCGLHTMHNAFKAGHSASGWDLGSFFNALTWLLKDSPARREDFATVTGSNCFPLEHCSHRWLENIPVAERALQIWPEIKKYIRHLNESGKPPNIKSFGVLLGFMNDKLLEVKLHFFLSVAKDLAPFLVRYQSEAPLIPFLTRDLTQLMKTVMRRFISEETLACFQTPLQLCGADLNKGHKDHIDLGFVTQRILRQKEEHGVSPKDLLGLRSSCKKFLISLLEKLQTKSPLSRRLMRNLAWVDPQMLTQASSCDLFNETLECLADSGRILSKDGDCLRRQFSKFRDSVMANKFSDFCEFDHNTTRLDIFWSTHLGKVPEFNGLWRLVRIVLLLSHGQAQVERGFSVNKEAMTTNMLQRTLVARRRTYDYIKAIGGVDNIIITPQLISAAANARARQKEEEQKQNKKRKKEEKEDHMAALKDKKRKLEKDIQSLQQGADSKAELAESEQDMRLLLESNAYRRRAKVLQDDLAKVEGEIKLTKKEVNSL